MLCQLPSICRRAELLRTHISGWWSKLKNFLPFYLSVVLVCCGFWGVFFECFWGVFLNCFLGWFFESISGCFLGWFLRCLGGVFWVIFGGVFEGVFWGCFFWCFCTSLHKIGNFQCRYRNNKNIKTSEQ